ncbi:hypothetical protein F1188_16305 [Roseospira marina]|uniref:Uncharacterized protein n=1 Tax=Roseospira marina TaxID=140057 RepID=A0A5M6I842_9PROT|nr:hypothetical protein [Roseospira marina]KAA5604420.1 hypothetical protein F1188_16305 [Roseospira marina]MBB4315383.1 hypothetical protein [Roseospira marina]MBB5088472.1 hypothetical protein [Roseospira marina]
MELRDIITGSAPGARLSESDATTHVERRRAPSARFALLDDMIVERGAKVDWDLLHNLHYKAENLPMGPKFWRLRLGDRTIAVLVIGLPKLMLRERHVALSKIKPGGKETWFTNRYRTDWINDNIRVVSRFVTDTQFRGVGIGYRMMNLVARLEGRRLIEIQSSMSKFNQFGPKAGFTFVRPQNASKYDIGLRFFRSTFAANPADSELIIQEIESADAPVRERMIQAGREFYYRHSALEKTGNNREKGAERVAKMDIHSIVKALQQLVLASPMYGLYMNPDAGRESLPQSLPLTAFGWQKPYEPLDLTRLDA